MMTSSATQLPLLLLLLALTLATVAVCQAPPKIDNYEHDELVRVNITEMKEHTIWCPGRPGFLGISDRKNLKFVSNSINHTVDLSYTTGNIESLNQMRANRLGAYHCLYRLSDTAPVVAYSFVFSEIPQEISETNVVRFDLNDNSPKEVTCMQATENLDFVWERYQDGTGLFVTHLEDMRKLTLTYNSMAKDHSKGFTIYRCYRRSTPEKIIYYEAKKSTTNKIRTFQTSNYSSQLIPKLVRPNDPLILECHGRSFSAVNVTPAFYYYGTSNIRTISSNYDRINCASNVNNTYTCSNGENSWHLQMKKFLPAQAGRYYCVKDGLVQRARVEGKLGEVYFRDIPAEGYWIRNMLNSIRCYPGMSTFSSSMRFTLYRKNMPSIVLTPGTTIDGYTAKLSKADSSDSLDLMFQFYPRPDANNATLVCALHYKYITTVLRIPVSEAVMVRKPSEGPKQHFMGCTIKDPSVITGKDTIVKIDNKDGSESKISIVRSNGNELIGINQASSEFAMYRCYRYYKGYKVNTTIAFGTPNATLDIYIGDDKNPSMKAFVAGRDIAVQCHFGNLPFQMLPQANLLRLKKNDTVLSLNKTKVNDTVFEYKLSNPGPEDAGVYQCVYGKTSILRSVPLNGTFRSPPAMVSICSSDSFVCDGVCKNKSILCDKKKDCVDGSDERPENCNACEPNSVPCQTLNGTEPVKKCVLKHWLCDGQDDCGNGFDEDISQQRKWCFKEESCKKCQPHETCCPGNNSICILRSYECDNEADCPGATDTRNCRKPDCLKLTKPTRREVITKKVGDTAELTCVAHGAERPTINWRRNWAAVPSAGATESNKVEQRDPSNNKYVVEGKLVLSPITKEMAGIYNCEAVNNCDRLMSFEIELRVTD